MPAETVVMGESGRIVIPAELRKKFGLKKGDRLTFSADGGSIRVRNMDMALKTIREGIIAKRGSLEGILDEFLEERRAEARREAGLE